MDRNNIITLYRQITIVRAVNVANQGPEAAQLVAPPPPPPRRNGCISAFIILILYAIGITVVTFGAKHLDDCPAEHRLPACIVAFGALFLVERIINCVQDCRNVFDADNIERPPNCLLLLNLLCSLSALGLFIRICIFNFSMHPKTDPSDHMLPDYCEASFYNATYWGCVAGLIMYSLHILCACCMGCAS